MSWFWCCQVHEDDSDMDSKEKEEQPSEKRKNGKKKSGRKWRIHWNKERKNNINKEEEAEKEKRLTNQQPAKVEEEANVLDLPVGLVSGSLESVSAETLENTAPPPQENLTEEEDAAIQHLMNTLLDQVGTGMEQLLRNTTWCQKFCSLVGAETECICPWRESNGERQWNGITTQTAKMRLLYREQWAQRYVQHPATLLLRFF
ncbi:hypothetical protein MHYP_G00257870 [Metynnis hypsauchen]